MNYRETYMYRVRWRVREESSVTAELSFLALFAEVLRTLHEEQHAVSGHYTQH